MCEQGPPAHDVQAPILLSHWPVYRYPACWWAYMLACTRLCTARREEYIAQVVTPSPYTEPACLQDIVYILDVRTNFQLRVQRLRRKTAQLPPRLILPHQRYEEEPCAMCVSRDMLFYAYRLLYDRHHDPQHRCLIAGRSLDNSNKLSASWVCMSQRAILPARRCHISPVYGNTRYMSSFCA